MSPDAPAGNPAERLIMIVDDEADVRLLIEFNVKKEGFQTITASHGLDALAKIEPRTPDLVVLDLMMPQQSGYEFLRALQAAGHGGIPIFIATARSLDTSTIQVIRQESNVVEFFTKPFNWPTFVGAIHKHLKTVRPSPRTANRPPSGDPYSG
jgi:CheY-like chemotaxis protein